MKVTAVFPNTAVTIHFVTFRGAGQSSGSEANISVKRRSKRKRLPLYPKTSVLFSGRKKALVFQKSKKTSTKSPTACKWCIYILNRLYTHICPFGLSSLHTGQVLEVKEETRVCS